MSELPPTGPSADADSDAGTTAPEPGSPEAPANGPRTPDFDTKDTQEIPVGGLAARAAGQGDGQGHTGSEPDASPPTGGEAGAAAVGSAEDAEDDVGLPASPDGLRSVVLSRVRETREELLRLIDRFLEQQERRARAAEEERERAELQRREQRELEETERRQRESLAAQAAVDVEGQLAGERGRIGELEERLALLAGMPEQVSSLQSDAVDASIELTRLRALVDELEGELKAAAVRAERLPALETQLAAAERRVARSGAVLASLRRAVVRLDEATSQTEVLARLLEEATGFASRSALFLVRRPQPLGELRLAAWGACGFTEQGAERIEVLAPPAWRGALEGRTLRGGAELGAPVALASESEAPLDALIVPFILRDETRALLYVDRFDADHPFEVDALQLMCFAATHALEVLPLRHQRPSGTLADADWAGSGEPAVETPPEPAVADALAGVDTSTTAPTALPLASVAALVATPPDFEAPSPDFDDAAREDAGAALVAEPPRPAEPPEPAQPPEVPAPEAPAVAEEAEPDPELRALDTAELGDLPPLEARPELTTQEVDVRALGVDPDAAEPPSPPVPVSPPSPPPPATFSSLLSPRLFGPADEPGVPPGRAALDSLLRPETPVPPPPPIPLRAEAEPSPTPPAPFASPPPEAAPPEPPPAPPSPATFGREVTPPSDIEGPGWAFASARRTVTDEEHAHEEAKRLARLLVSELQLYNEEEIDEGRRQGNVYRFLKEHIDKSRMLYEERVDERIRETTDYFREEMVKTLAGGDPARLGF